ncbi:MAG: NADH-quinone oxidoreductase subunit L, partial [Anaerolineae bacterium]|nr:NADH-quinone oxidoreductase subunit L [Anaerolineae bacterium]
MLQYAWLVLVFPLAGVLINAFFGYRLGRRACGALATVAVALSFLWGVGVLAGLLSRPAEAREVHLALWDWVVAGDLHVGLSLLVDPLSVVMLLVVTGVGALIHLYSNGYMREDPDYARFFTYLNLFIVGMLLLVLADNFLLLYLGWEAVGLCSYLLIGFWYQKKSAADAGKKAFIVNRVGDFGFALGIMLIFATFGTLGFREVFERAPVMLQAGGAVATAITLLLFTGAVGKSAQIPLYVWLPDAMEGPTPVSALIHAATMVTAGVYMVARTHVLFALAPFSSAVVAAIGTLTAIYAASIALVQTDIKRVLAYSTISQLGYMFLAVGVGAYAAGIFHLTTHAFFKALLFLGAGSVIHALGGEQDMRRMGGLFGKLRVTGTTFVVAWLAISGIPPLSGFFSKDEILAAAYHSGNVLLWLLGLITAGLTAFYMSRAVFMTFFGDSRVSPEAAHHLHESPPTMTLPLAALAVLAAVASLLAGDSANEALYKSNLATLSQAKASDTWSEFQADSLKKYLQTTHAETLTLLGAPPEQIEAARQEAKRRQSLQNGLKEEAQRQDGETKALLEESRQLLERHRVFALGVTLFQVAIGLSAIAALLRLRWVWWVSL